MGEEAARDTAAEALAIAPGVTMAPVPPFVDLPDLEKPAVADPHFVVAGLSVLLDDSQLDLTGPLPAEFYRRAEMVVDVSGVQHVARFGAEFDPAHERLEIHYIRIHRGGQTLVRGAPAEFEVLRRERNLEMRRFDGRLTVHLEIPDVRVGDIVETAYTIIGEPVAVAGRWSSWRSFEWSPAGQVETRFRLLAPARRPIVTKQFGGDPPDYQDVVDGDTVDRRWFARGRRGRKLEPLAPPWTFQLSRLQLSEWRDWAEVVERFTPYYDETSPVLSDELAAKVEELAGIADPAERAAALLYFVQAEVRYLTISMGQGGLIPRPLHAIWETRYGDCKDVTKTFVLLARRLGLDACPALVNTGVGECLDTLLPSPGAFDHAIIRLHLDGQTYWLDATLSPQPSPLKSLMQVRFGWALPLKPGATALERMGADPNLTICECEETIILPGRTDKPATYEWTIVSRGWRAESLRAEIARHGEVGHFRQREERMQSVWPEATLTSRSVEDDIAQNAVTMRMRFDVPGAWEEEDNQSVRFTTKDTILANALAPLDPGPVKLPIYLGGLGRIARKVSVTMPVDWVSPGWSKSVVHQAISVHQSFAPAGKREFRLEQELKIRETTMPGDAAERYREMVAELGATDVFFTTRAKKGKILPPGKAKGGLDWLWALWVLAAIGMAIYRSVTSAG
jgi:transglutaminase-like putative cysteine protease